MLQNIYWKLPQKFFRAKAVPKSCINSEQLQNISKILKNKYLNIVKFCSNFIFHHVHLPIDECSMIKKKRLTLVSEASCYSLIGTSVFYILQEDNTVVTVSVLQCVLTVCVRACMHACPCFLLCSYFSHLELICNEFWLSSVFPILYDICN